jgi:hypothetical protein
MSKLTKMIRNIVGQGLSNPWLAWLKKKPKSVENESNLDDEWKNLKKKNQNHLKNAGNLSKGYHRYF